MPQSYIMIIIPILEDCVLGEWGPTYPHPVFPPKEGSRTLRNYSESTSPQKSLCPCPASPRRRGRGGGGR
eukprot:1899879-Pyramimonas_sp.AAC.1